MASSDLVVLLLSDAPAEPTKATSNTRKSVPVNAAEPIKANVDTRKSVPMDTDVTMLICLTAQVAVSAGYIIRSQQDGCDASLVDRITIVAWLLSLLSCISGVFLPLPQFVAVGGCNVIIHVVAVVALAIYMGVAPNVWLLLCLWFVPAAVGWCRLVRRCRS